MPPPSTLNAPVEGRLGLTSLCVVVGIDLRTLALFRVLLGVYLLADLVGRARDLTAHYSDFGLMPRGEAVAFLSSSSWSFHLAGGSAVFQGALFVLGGVFAGMLALGWRTRLATFASWALLLSLQNRNTMILSGEDNLALLLLFWSMFLPLGARASVDAALNSDAPPRSNAFVSVATAALLIQGMSMYLFSALLKSDPIWVPDGTAVYYALQLDYLATPFALWFRQFEALLQGLTYYVWGLELIGPILIFSPILHRPLRAALMVAFITMHLGFWMCLEIGLFPLISIIMNLTFMPGWMWDTLDKWLRPARPSNLCIWYDSDCDFCRKLSRLIATLLMLGDIPVRPAQSSPRIGPLLEQHNSWVVTDGTEDHLRWSAFLRLVAVSPVFRPLAGALAWRPIAAVGECGYLWVARNRPRLAAIAAPAMRERPLRVAPRRTGSIAAALALIFITIQNISTLPAAGLRLPEEFRSVRQALGLYQNWTMFAPYPELNSPWPVIRGELADGTIVDVYNRQTGAPSTDRPAVVSAVYANGRWRKYLSQLEDQSYEPVPQRLALNYARYLCRSWNTGRQPHEMLMTFTIRFHVERTNPPGEPDTTTVRTVWTHDCFG